MPSLIPKFLSHGDKIALIATARKVSLTEMEPAIKTLKSWGLQVIPGEHLYSIHHQFAGTDGERAMDLQTAIDDPDIKAIICARGGYGTARILDSVNLESLKKSPKWIIGFSDLTSLHCQLNQTGIATMHAVMPILFNEAGVENSLESLKNLLFGENINYKTSAHIHNKLGIGKGELVGGNLSVLHSIINTSSDIDLANKILFIEDVDEYLYHIDRMMLHFKKSGRLKHLSGLIVGHFSSMKDNLIPFGTDALEIIKEHISEYDYPVCFGFPVGHAYDNVALLCGANATLEVTDKEGLLVYEGF